MNVLQKQTTINCNGKLLDLSQPKVMGIINNTADSFYDASRCNTPDTIAAQAEKMIAEGAEIIDVGAFSTRPGCAQVSEQEELERIRTALSAIRTNFPDVVISVDTFRSSVARMSAEEFGVGIINDISGGYFDPELFKTVAETRAAYILMHSIGNPLEKHQTAQCTDIVDNVIKFLYTKIDALRQAGVKDIILDPGFGFGKTLDQNYELLNHMDDLKIFNLPVLVGVSRKSMIFKLLETDPEHSLNGTSVINTIAMDKGADILRVHDVKQAVEVIKICQKTGL